MAVKKITLSERELDGISPPSAVLQNSAEARLRNAMCELRDKLSEEDIVRIWREILVNDVMEGE